MDEPVLYGYCVLWNTSDERTRREDLSRCGVNGSDMFFERLTPPAQTERREYRRLKYRLRNRDTVVIPDLWHLGRDFSEIAAEWSDLIWSKCCDIVVLNCSALSTNSYGNDRPLVTELCGALFSYLADHESAKMQPRIGRPRIARPADFSKVYAMVRERRITNRTAMQILGLKPNTYYNFARQERERYEEKR